MSAGIRYTTLYPDMTAAMTKCRRESTEYSTLPKIARVQLHNNVILAQTGKHSTVKTRQNAWKRLLKLVKVEDKAEIVCTSAHFSMPLSTAGTIMHTQT